MNSLLIENGEDKTREIFPSPVEPRLINEKLLGSSSREQIIKTPDYTSANSSPATLSGSFSFGNLAYFPPEKISTDHYVPSITSSCSIGALDQIKSTEITKLFDHLFLGSQKDALDNELLLRHKITRVINLSQNCPRPTSVPDDLKHFLRIPVNDTYSAKLLPHFDSAYQFIENAKKEGEKVLIHCLAGISRSPTIAIAYVMRSKRMTNDEAYSYVKFHRPTISPNFNFLGQLFEYERILRQQNILPFYSPSSTPTSSSNFELKNEQINNELIKKKGKENQKNNNLQHKPSLPISLLPTTTKIARPRHLLTSKEDLMNFRHSCPSTTTNISFSSSKSSLPFSPTDIPSPSNEFSKLDISLVNPCFINNNIKNNLNENKKEEENKIFNSKLKTSTGIENPVFDLNLKKIKTLSKYKEATTNNNNIFELNKLEEEKLIKKDSSIRNFNLNKKILKSKKERNNNNNKLLKTISKPSFISYLKKEEENISNNNFEEEEENKIFKNIPSTRNCLVDIEDEEEELTKFGSLSEFGEIPFDKINKKENKLINNNKGKKYFFPNSLKFSPEISSKEEINNNEKQKTKMKLYSYQFANATICSIQNLYNKLPQQSTSNNNKESSSSSSLNILQNSTKKNNLNNYFCRLFPQQSSSPSSLNDLINCNRKRNFDSIQQQKNKKISIKKSPTLATIRDDEKTDEEEEKELKI